jgi:hypothetical protein
MAFGLLVAVAGAASRGRFQSGDCDGRQQCGLDSLAIGAAMGAARNENAAGKPNRRMAIPNLPRATAQGRL